MGREVKRGINKEPTFPTPHRPPMNACVQAQKTPEETARLGEELIAAAEKADGLEDVVRLLGDGAPIDAVNEVRTPRFLTPISTRKHGISILVEPRLEISRRSHAVQLVL